MDFHTEAATPPRTTNEAGEPRRIGVEIEFAAIAAREGAAIIRDLFGGEIREEDAHRFRVEGAEFGRFVCELDTQFAHRASGDGPDAEADESPLLAEFQIEMRRLFGDVSSLIMPCEIVCPPIPLEALGRLDGLVARLIEAGAAGTRSSPLYAFGAQLNPEVAATDAGYLAAMLKAYLLVSPWLRAVMDIDVTRRIVTFVDPFPVDYVRKVIAPDYQPDRKTLIRDYLLANPTRNRELDLLPLFAHLEPDLVRRWVDDPRVKPRPAFHYRLPDANIGESGWSITLEWNRWAVVERLAEDEKMREGLAEEYLARATRWPRKSWALKVGEWLALS